jgi:hypothetical protein
LLSAHSFKELISAPLLSSVECAFVLDTVERLDGWRLAGGVALDSRVLNVPSDNVVANLIKVLVVDVMKQQWQGECAFLIYDESAVVRYSIGAAVPAHTDVNPAKRHRIFSFVVYLTDNFVGGALRIPALDFEGVLPLGWVVAFPSTEVHSASEVLAGDKSVLVGFLSSIYR